MYKVILNVEGMMCEMCEAHVNKAVRNVCNAEKVTSSHTNGITEIIVDGQPDVARIKKAVKDTGYNVVGVTVEAL